MPQHQRDLTPPPGPESARGTGPARDRRPVYVDLLPPCNHACPAGEPIQAWLAQAQAGDYRAAWETLVADNPLPAVHGRVCYHPCETACNRGELDAAVSIHAVERFLGDRAATEHWKFSVDAASGCWWLAPVPAGCPPPIISRGSGTRSKSARRVRSPAA